ncbi:MAG TPA: RdgB/HAM1 family non-canonical purine NTP pyrophosphatase [Bacteroidetes bacterium]|nr:RdgB/HAM1 family non-canonical purine NTP pyrophosphatase [Bacteroidota bacterium]
MKILIASRNPDKLREIQNKVSSLDIQIVSPKDFPNLPEIEEDGDTLEANAIKKAVALHKLTNLPALADDTGLEVEALDGRPGLYSARYAGPEATYQDNVKKLLEELQGVPEERRGAVVRCVLAYASGPDVKLFEGAVKGMITDKPQGKNGFGYDPVFFIPEEGKTFAQMPLERKNSISHRGLALDAWVQYLRREIMGDK